MLLAVDIGNTNIGLAIFEGEKLKESWRISTEHKRLADEYGVLLMGLFCKYEINSAIISSVVIHLTEVFKSALLKYFDVDAFILNHKSKMPITITQEEPGEVGADRIANAAGAVLMYNLPAIVVDFGTATTFDVVDANRNFLGGLIAPGLSLQAQSLSSNTSKLPNLKLEVSKHAIGKNTIDAMLAGIVRGHACMVEGMIKETEKELGKKATIIATGGFSSVLFEELERKFDHIDKNLTYEGLRYLHEINCKEQNG